MLSSLTIRNILIIEHLTLELGTGLNILTGETGAGKSILLDALGFVLGWRGPADLVRQGQNQGEVEASFRLDKKHPAQTLLKEAGFEIDEELVIRRQNHKDGRKIAWINERRCSSEFLRNLGRNFVELHGQHDEYGLLDSKAHRQCLDDFMQNGKQLCREVKDSWHAFKKIEEECILFEKNMQKLRMEEEYMRFSLEELEGLSLQIGEYEQLEKEWRLMQASERIRTNILQACQLLSDENFGNILTDVSRLLHGVSDKAEGHLEEAIDGFERAENGLEETIQALQSCLSDMDFSPEDIDKIQERLFAIRTIARKHNIEAEALVALTQELREKIASLEDNTEYATIICKKRDVLQQRYHQTARKLREARRITSKKLTENMHKELTPLKMQMARFEVEISEADASAKGIDKVHFKVATNPNTPPGALNKIASGGELSRFILALKLCLNRGQNYATLIFDEIDTGIGGATADAVGRRLYKLAQDGQILVVTHSPQIAARANQHWRIEKTTTKHESKAHAEALSQKGREQEIARMLAGTVISEEALKAARALILDKK